MNITRVILEASSDANDFTYSLTDAGLFAGLEVYIGIITACLPTLGPLITRKKSGYGLYRRKAYTPPSRSSFKGPLKGTISSRIFNQRDFDRLGEDDISLRQVPSHDGKTDTTAWLAGSRGDISPNQSAKSAMLDGVISVKTDMQIFRSSMEEECESV